MSKPLLLDLLRAEARLQGKSLGTERKYCMWVKRYILFHNKQHPRNMGVTHLKYFLEHLAVDEEVSASTQNSAFSAIHFLYKDVLKMDTSLFQKIKRPKISRNMKESLSEDEVGAIIEEMSGLPQLMVRLIYGSGILLKECIRLRTQDIHFDRSQVFVRYSNENGRWTLLPQLLHEELKAHLVKVKNLHDKDLRNGFGYVRLHYHEDVSKPILSREWGWQWLFPSQKFSTDPRSPLVLRHHVHQSFLQKYIAEAVRKSGISRLVSIMA